MTARVGLRPRNYRRHRNGPHRSTGAGPGQLLRYELVLDQERALAYPSPRHSPGELAQKGLLRAGQAEPVDGALGLGRRPASMLAQEPGAPRPLRSG